MLTCKAVIKPEKLDLFNSLDCLLTPGFILKPILKLSMLFLF